MRVAADCASAGGAPASPFPPARTCRLAATVREPSAQASASDCHTAPSTPPPPSSGNAFSCGASQSNTSMCHVAHTPPANSSNTTMGLNKVYSTSAIRANGAHELRPPIKEPAAYLKRVTAGGGVKPAVRRVADARISKTKTAVTELQRAKTELETQLIELSKQTDMKDVEIHRLKAEVRALLAARAGDVGGSSLQVQTDCLDVPKFVDACCSPLGERKKSDTVFDPLPPQTLAPSPNVDPFRSPLTPPICDSAARLQHERSASVTDASVIPPQELACLHSKLVQMEERQHSTTEELQATLQELNELQDIVDELGNDNARLQEQNNTLYEAACVQTQKYEHGRLQIEHLKYLLLSGLNSQPHRQLSAAAQLEAGAERERRLLQLLKSAYEEQEDVKFRYFEARQAVSILEDSAAGKCANNSDGRGCDTRQLGSAALEAENADLRAQLVHLRTNFADLESRLHNFHVSPAASPPPQQHRMNDSGDQALGDVPNSDETDKLVAELKTEKEARRLEQAEWKQFQADLQTAVRVATDFKLEAQAELEANRDALVPLPEPVKVRDCPLDAARKAADVLAADCDRMKRENDDLRRRVRNLEVESNAMAAAASPLTNKSADCILDVPDFGNSPAGGASGLGRRIDAYLRASNGTVPTNVSATAPALVSPYKRDGKTTAAAAACAERRPSPKMVTTPVRSLIESLESQSGETYLRPPSANKTVTPRTPATSPSSRIAAARVRFDSINGKDGNESAKTLANDNSTLKRTPGSVSGRPMSVADDCFSKSVAPGAAAPSKVGAKEVGQKRAELKTAGSESDIVAPKSSAGEHTHTPVATVAPMHKAAPPITTTNNTAADSSSAATSRTLGILPTRPVGASRKASILDNISTAASACESVPSDPFSRLMKDAPRQSRRNALLKWCQSRCAKYKDVEITNFSSSWVDGLALCALIHSHAPHMIDFQSLDKNNPVANLNAALSSASALWGRLPVRLDVAAMLSAERPDWRTVIAFVTELFKRIDCAEVAALRE